MKSHDLKKKFFLIESFEYTYVYHSIHFTYILLDCKILYNLYSVIFDISEERCVVVIQFAKKSLK